MRALEDAEMTWARHRGGRHRHRARHLRRRDDARAVPRRRARRGGQADHARAHRGQRRRFDRRRRRASRRVGRARACAHLAFEKQSEGDTNFAFSAGRSGGVGAGGYFAPHIRAYIERSGAPDYVGPMVAVKDRQNALKNPYAHLQIPDISIEMVLESPCVWDADPPARVVPDLRRRVRDGAHRRGRRRPRAPPGVGARHRDAHRARVVPGPRPGEPARRPGLRGRRLPPGRHHQPARRIRRRRDLRAVQLVRADVDGEPRLRRPKARAGG